MLSFSPGREEGRKGVLIVGCKGGGEGVLGGGPLFQQGGGELRDLASCPFQMGSLGWGSSRENPKKHRLRMSQDAGKRKGRASRRPTRVNARSCTGAAMQFPGCKTCRVPRAPPWQGRGPQKCFPDSPPLPSSAQAARPRTHPTPRDPGAKVSRVCASLPRRRGAAESTLRAAVLAAASVACRGVSSSAGAPSAGRRRAAWAGELMGAPTEGRRRGGGTPVSIATPFCTPHIWALPPRRGPPAPHLGLLPFNHGCCV